MAGCHLSTRFASTVVSVKLGHPFRCRRLMAPACIALLAAFFYAALLSKVLPPFENQVLLAVQDDSVLLLTCTTDSSCDNRCFVSALAQHEDVQTRLKMEAFVAQFRPMARTGARCSVGPHIDKSWLTVNIKSNHGTNCTGWVCLFGFKLLLSMRCYNYPLVLGSCTYGIITRVT
ncbi:hypothetical protein ACP70R_040070 [Stipagrostis hirtigluma subsp. patula]